MTSASRVQPKYCGAESVAVDDPQNAVANVSPVTAYDTLKNDPAALLVDVRTRPEWSFVGVPDLSDLAREPILIEWRQFPEMGVNSDFAQSLLEAAGGALPQQMLFICRSGARSMEAANAVVAFAQSRGEAVRCFNVAEGFEGDLDADRHRGALNGWKARGLPWRQS